MVTLILVLENASPYLTLSFKPGPHFTMTIEIANQHPSDGIWMLVERIFRLIALWNREPRFKIPEQIAIG